MSFTVLYSSAQGWSNWAMNGGHTDWAAGKPVEAVQILFKWYFRRPF